MAPFEGDFSEMQGCQLSVGSIFDIRVMRFWFFANSRGFICVFVDRSLMGSNFRDRDGSTVFFSVCFCFYRVYVAVLLLSNCGVIKKL